MKTRHSIIENVVLPISDLITGQSVRKDLTFLMQSQHWSLDQMTDFQNYKLRELIQYAYKNVEYYNILFDNLNISPNDIKSKEDLKWLPILTKKTVKENIRNGKLLSSNLKPSSLIRKSSSGSTGEPLQFYETKKSYSMNIAANLRGWYNMGYRMGDKYLKLSVNPRSSTIKRIQDFANNCIYFSSKGVDEIDIRNLIFLVKRKRPKFLRGYPSTLSIIAKYIIKHNVIIKNITAIATTGEILFPEMRHVIETAFNTKVFDAYSGEGTATMFQDKMGNYRIAHEYAITELFKENGNIEKENAGEIITTDLWNYANPFIRYAVNDSIEIYPEDSNATPMLAKKIIGRNVDMLKTPSGKTLIVHFFTGYFEWITSVIQFQIRQDNPTDFVLSLIVDEKFTVDIKNEIFEHVKKYIGDDAILKMEIVSTIPPKVNGKTRFMIKNFTE